MPDLWARPPDQPVREPRQFITLGAITTTFDWSLKLIPLLWIAFQFYATQEGVAKKAAANEKKITEIETSFNKLDRELVEVKANLSALHEKIESDRQFFFETQRRR